MLSSNMLGLNLWRIKKAKIVLNGLMEIVNEPNKLLVNQGKEFYNNLTQK